MAVSKKRKKPTKKVQHTAPINPQERANHFLYLTDFMMNVADSVTEYSLITYERYITNDRYVTAHEGQSIADMTVEEDRRLADKYDYILFRTEEGKLLEHTNGSDLVDKLANAIAKKDKRATINLTVHYFDRENVHDQGNGMLFNIPYRAVRWTLVNDEFQPDETGEYTTGDVLIEPGTPFDRSTSLGGIQSSAVDMFTQGKPVQMKKANHGTS